MNKNDLFILSAFVLANKVNEFQSFNIAGLLQRLNGRYSHTKVRSVVKYFIDKGYIKEGYRQGNSKTYYITEDGISFLESFDVYKEE